MYVKPLSSLQTQGFPHTGPVQRHSRVPQRYCMKPSAFHPPAGEISLLWIPCGPQCLVSLYRSYVHTYFLSYLIVWRATKNTSRMSVCLPLAILLHPVHKPWLTICYMPDTVLGTEEPHFKRQQGPNLKEFIFWKTDMFNGNHKIFSDGHKDIKHSEIKDSSWRRDATWKWSIRKGLREELAFELRPKLYKIQT